MATAPLSTHHHPSVQSSQASHEDPDSVVISRSVYDRVLGRLNRVYSHRPNRDILWTLSKLQSHGESERDD